MTRYRKHAVGLLALIIAGLVVAFLLGAFASNPQRFKTVFGFKLAPAAVEAYQALDKRNYHAGSENETPPPGVINAARIRARNVRLADTLHPLTLAAREPITVTRLVRNYSGRNGARPALLVVHDAEMPASLPNQQGLYAIAAWFNNPQAQASSNTATDAFGNTIRMVPDDAKAWTQAFFNPEALSDELLGYASQTVWPDAQLRAVAELFAAWSVKYGIPVQHALVSGCSIVRPGILQHSDLGQCGGGHHDAGPHFPITRFIRMVAEYRAGLLANNHATRCTPRQIRVALNKHGAHLAVQNGPLGKYAHAAIQRFQHIHHIRSTGKVGPPTVRALGLKRCLA